MMSLLITFLFFSYSSLGQTVQIGTVSFFNLNNEKRPPQTVYASMDVFENNLKGKGRKIPLYIEVLPSKNKILPKESMFILMGGPGQAVIKYQPCGKHRKCKTRLTDDSNEI